MLSLTPSRKNFDIGLNKSDAALPSWKPFFWKVFFFFFFFFCIFLQGLQHAVNYFFVVRAATQEFIQPIHELNICWTKAKKVNCGSKNWPTLQNSRPRKKLPHQTEHAFSVLPVEQCVRNFLMASYKTRRPMESVKYCPTFSWYCVKILTLRHLCETPQLVHKWQTFSFRPVALKTKLFFSQQKKNVLPEPPTPSCSAFRWLHTKLQFFWRFVAKAGGVKI